MLYTAELLPIILSGSSYVNYVEIIYLVGDNHLGLGDLSRNRKKNNTSSPSMPSTPHLGEEIKQVIASYGMLHIDTNIMWEPAMSHSSKN